MIIGFGLDVHDVRGMERDLEKFLPEFTEAEIALCESRAERMACYTKRHCAKEALAKALGGNEAYRNVHHRDMEVVNTSSGRPVFVLHDTALWQLEALMRDKAPPGTVAHIHLTITDYYPTVNAAVIIEARPCPT